MLPPCSPQFPPLPPGPPLTQTQPFPLPLSLPCPRPPTGPLVPGPLALGHICDPSLTPDPCLPLQALHPCSCPLWWAFTTIPSLPGLCGTSSTPSKSLCPGASVPSTRTEQVRDTQDPTGQRPSSLVELETTCPDAGTLLAGPCLPRLAAPPCWCWWEPADMPLCHLAQQRSMATCPVPSCQTPSGLQDTL